MAARRAVVAHESMFGNTEAVATAVADGLREEGYDVTTVDVTVMPTVSPADVDVLVVGAPTHAFSLSRASTRKDAVRQGAPPIHGGVGLREWIAALPASGLPPFAVFDTRVAKARRLPSAGRTAARLMSRRSDRLLVPVAGFTVADVKGPLSDGELSRARAWGRTVGRAAARAAKGPCRGRDLGPAEPAPPALPTAS